MRSTAVDLVVPILAPFIYPFTPSPKSEALYNKLVVLIPAHFIYPFTPVRSTAVDLVVLLEATL